MIELATGPTLVVGGGVDRQGIEGLPLATSEFYDINTGTWSLGPEMPDRIFATSSVELG